MSLASVIQSEVSSVFLNTDDFAETVTQTPAAGGGGSVVALVDRLDPVYDTARGREVHQNLKLTVDDAVTCLVTDKWTVGGDDYQVVAVKPAESGAIVVFCQVTTIENRREGGQLL